MQQVQQRSAQEHLTATATYTLVSVVSAAPASCSTAASGSAVVTVNPLPTASISGSTSFCSGGSADVTFTGTPNATVVYTLNGTTQSLILNASGTITINTGAITNNRTYTLVNVTSAAPASCINTVSGSVVISVDAPPTASAGGGGNVCTASTINLSASGGTTYNWSGGGITASTQNQQNPIIGAATVGMSGTYVVTVTDVNGCTDTASTTVTVAPCACPNPPTVSGLSSVDVCAGTTTNLSVTLGGGATTATWTTSGSGTFNTPTGTSVTYTPSAADIAAGSVTITITTNDPDGANTQCNAATTTTTVSINALPTAAISGTNTICAGDNTTLTASGGNAYNWTLPNGGGTSSANPLNISNATNTNAGVYTVTVTNANNCTAVANTTVTVNALPNATAGGATVCVGDAINLTSSGGTTYSWSGSGITASTQNQQNPSIAASTAGMAGIYTVTVTGNNTCTATASTTVIVNANPVGAINGTLSFCEGGSTTLTATGGTAYTWSGAGISNPNQAQQIIGGLAAGSYSYAVTVSNGNCSATATTNLTVNAAPAPQITGSATFCFGGSSTLDAGSGYTTYLWTPGNFATQSITVTSSGTYTVEVTNVAGCTSTDQIVVTAAASLTPNISTNSPICAGENATLDAGNSFTTYAWSQGGNSSTVTATPAITTTYTVTVTQAGCSGTATAQVVVNPIPTATITGNAPICAGGSINLTANGGGTYLWNGAFGSNASITDSPAATTTYTVTVTNNGCSSTASTSVTVNPLPTASAGVNSNICEGTSINLTASGGTSYNWSGAGITASTQNQQNPVIASATVGMSGIYSVTVTDGNTCSSVASVTATVAVCSCPNPATVTASSAAICSGATANLTATIGGGATTATWTTSGNGTFDTTTGTSVTYTPSAADIAAGNVSITITTDDPDGNNTQCSAATTTITLTINAQPNALATPTQPTCSTDTGSILVTPAGATYAWTGGLTGSNPTNLNAGTYTVTVTAAGGCSATASTTINPPISFVATATASQPSCGLTNGGIAVTPTGAGFSYAWTGTLTGANPTNLNAGTYTVTVTATASGCTATASATLNNNAGLTPTLTPTQPSCGLDNGEISVNPTGANYSYNWSTAGVTGANPTDLTSGTYTVTVTETVAGCSATASVTLNASSAITATATATPASCGLNNGSILVTSAGTTYVWSDAALSGANPSNLAAGTYTVTVTATGGCTATASAIVTTSAALTATATPTQPTCGLDNGSILVTPAGATSYVWSDAALIGANPTNLAAGTYTVTVTAAGGCTATASATLNTSSNATASVTATQPSCGLDNGSILVNSPGTYVWSGGLTGANPINLAAGTYTVTVTAAGGCTASASTTLNPSSTITATATPTATTCGLDNGSISVTPTGANYAWTGGLTGSDPINVGAGSYTVTVTAAGGCTVITSITVDPSTALTATATATQPTCGLNNGSISVTPTGGTYVWSDATLTGANPTNVAAGTYTVTVTLGGCSSNTSIALNTSSAITASVNITQPSCGLDNGSILVNSPGAYTWSDATLTGANPINLAPGTYTVTVTAANGCTASTQATLNASSALTASAAPTQPTCSTDTGSILVTSVGATSYAWSDAALTGANPTNVVAGTYTVTVSAAGGCTATASTTINNPISIVAAAVGSQPSCGLTNGGIAVTPTGAGFNYAWTGGLTGATPSNLAAGTYTVTVTATATGCTSSALVVLVNDAGLTASLIPTQPSCGLDNGAISVNPAGANYSYNWSTAGVTGSNPTDLTSGTYTVTVTETTAGCSATASVTLNTSNPITASATTTPTTCGLNNGGLSATPTGGTYLWTGGLAGANPTNVASGTYTLTVTDTNGCTATTSATVAASNALTATANITQPTCGLDNGSIAITPAGATYTWTGGLTGANPSNVAAGNYALTVTDAGGCSSTLTVTVNASTAITATATPTQPTCGLNNGSILVTPAGATYVWSDATLTGANPTNLAPGTYTVTVTAAGGCTASASTILNTSSTITATATPTATTCGLDNGSIVVTPAGGSYTWTGGLTGATPTNIAAGSYTVTVTAAGGCTVITSITVDASTAITATATPTQPTCGLDNGSILVTPAGATYAWTGGLAGANPTGVITGTYSVTVTAAGGCTATASATIDPSTAITATVTPTQPTCGLNNGSILVTPAGATYAWTGGLAGANPTNVAAGTYTVTVTAAGGCTATASATLNTSSAPTAPVVTGLNNPYCVGETVDALSVTPNQGGTITWYANTDLTLAVATGNTYTPPTGVQAGAVSYWVVEDANGCQSPATQLDVTFEVCVTCNVQTPIGVTTALTTCEGTTNTAALEVTNNDPNATIHWYDAANIEVATGNTFVPTTAGTYTAIAIANNDPTCQSPAVTATLTETILGDAGFVYDEDTYCQGTNNITPTITGTSGGTFSATGGLVIDPATGTFNATTAGTFTITYDVTGNCPATNTFVVTVIPSVTIAISGNTTINLGENTQLTATGATTYTWTANATLSCTDCAAPVATPTQTTTYTVQTAGGECAEPASVTVLVNMPQHLVIIPNAFSPNNDGTNDIFHIGGVNIATIHLAIYDRWGQKMFEAEGDIDTFWDGTYKGFDCELGVYVYYLNVTYTDGTKEMFKNNLTLVR
ncbi:MAG: gliding motility-associated C-terminal domain-containing protein [Sphingobacteriales bacterium]|nr:gliding motility-associated C-terminal domain-containing protein [Sphingobacteriales bacterium]